MKMHYYLKKFKLIIKQFPKLKLIVQMRLFEVDISIGKCSEENSGLNDPAREFSIPKILNRTQFM